MATDLRQDFEDWLINNAESESRPPRNKRGAYIEPEVHLAWEAVQEFAARRAVPAQASAPEVVKYEMRMRPTWRGEGEGWTSWEECSEGAHRDYLRLTLYNDWQYETRALCVAAHQQAQGDTSERVAKDAARYRWLRDKSEPGICAFYLSVGKAFDGVKFNQGTVDEAIDAQIAAANNPAPESTP